MLNEKDTAQLAAWDQIEAWVEERFNHLSDEDLLQVVAQCEDVNLIGCMHLTPLAYKSLAFVMLYEHRRRNGGFGRTETNPCEDMTP